MLVRVSIRRVLYQFARLRHRWTGQVTNFDMGLLDSAHFAISLRKKTKENKGGQINATMFIVVNMVANLENPLKLHNEPTVSA